MSNLEGYEAANRSSGLHGERRIQSPTKPNVSELVEVVRKSSNGYDIRTNETFYKFEKLGVYSSKQAALEAVVAKYLPDIVIKPLEIDG